MYICSNSLLSTRTRSRRASRPMHVVLVRLLLPSLQAQLPCNLPRNSPRSPPRATSSTILRVQPPAQLSAFNPPLNLLINLQLNLPFTPPCNLPSNTEHGPASPAPLTEPTQKKPPSTRRTAFLLAIRFNLPALPSAPCRSEHLLLLQTPCSDPS